MVMSPPPYRDPILLGTARHTGNPKRCNSSVTTLYDLKHIFANGEARLIQDTGNGSEVYNTRGTFKRFGVVGLRQRRGFQDD